MVFPFIFCSVILRNWRILIFKKRSEKEAIITAVAAAITTKVKLVDLKKKSNTIIKWRIERA